MGDQLSADLASLRIQRDVDPEAKGARRTRLAVGCLALLALAAVYPVYRVVSARVFKTEVEVTEIRLVSPAQSSIQVTSTGYVVPAIQSKVGAKLLGRVSEVDVREGDVVAVGDVLVRQDDAEAQVNLAGSRARVAAARARVQSAEASAADAKRQFEREKGLAAQGASMRATVDDLENKLAVLEQSASAARAEANAAAAELSQIELSLKFLTIVAPIAGVITTKPVDVGELVGPQSAPVAEISDFGSLVVETDVPEARLSLVAKGGPAEIVLDAFPTVRQRGQVTEIGSRVNRAKATVVVKVAFVDPVEGVIPDMSARVSFLEHALDPEAAKEPPKLFVPAAALVDHDGGKAVFRIDDGKAVLTPVRVGAPMTGGFELTEGPADGTKVVSNPPSAIADGYPIAERAR